MLQKDDTRIAKQNGDKKCKKRTQYISLKKQGIHLRMCSPFSPRNSQILPLSVHVNGSGMLKERKI